MKGRNEVRKEARKKRKIGMKEEIKG